MKTLLHLVILLFAATAAFGQKELRDSLLTQAQNEIFNGRFSEAKQLLQISPEKEGSSKYLLTAALLELFQGRQREAMVLLTEAQETLRKENKQRTLEEAEVISWMSQALKSSGKDHEAQELAMMAFDIRKEKLDDNHELIAASYNNLGLAFANSDNERALDHYENAKERFIRLYGDDHERVAIINTNLAFIYREEKLYGDAINSLEEALKIYQKQFAGSHPLKAFIYFNLGKTYRQMRDIGTAEIFYKKCLSEYTGVFGAHHPDIARVYNELASISLEKNLYDSAVINVNQSIRANVPDYRPSSAEENPGLTNFYHGNVLLNSLELKARIYEAQYLGRSLRFADLKHSLATVTLCDTLIDLLRKQITSEADKIELSNTSQNVYALGVRVAFEAADNSPRPGQYVHRAFFFSEKSKSAVLQDAISESNAKSFAGLPDDVLERENNLRTTISSINQKLAQRPERTLETALRAELYEATKNYNELVATMEKAYPSYYQLKHAQVQPSAAAVQKLLGADDAVVSYFYDREGSRMYIFTVSSKKLRVEERSLPPHFERYITGLRNSLIFNEPQTYQVSVNQLNKVLLPRRLPSSVKNLIIIPTGKMSTLPFEALTYRKATGTSFREFNYLIRKYTIRYEFSTGLMLQEKKTDRPGNGIVLCAPIAFDAKLGLADLPGTDKEVNAIAELYQRKNQPVRIHLKQDATEQIIKETGAGNFAVIHLATHGVVDESDPEQSRIFLHQKDGEDGNLFSGEIYNLRLNTSLVTLSACQTGLGKISQGEGVIGLSRALTYAGADNLMVSFWSVADASTAELMANFYEDLLLKNKSYAEALQSAKQKMLGSDQYASPYYWAPFILIGF